MIKNAFFVVIYKRSTLYLLFIFFCQHRSLPHGTCRFFVSFLVLLRYAALNFHFFVLSSSSKVTLTLPSWSLLFPPHSLVSTAILCYTGFMIFVLEG